MSSALSLANSFFNVTVEEDDPPFDGARRFVVYFNEPEIGVGVLGVAESNDDGDCEWLQCLSDGDDDDEEGGDCDDSGVLVNRDKSVFVEEGAVEVCVCVRLATVAECSRLRRCREIVSITCVGITWRSMYKVFSKYILFARPKCVCAWVSWWIKGYMKVRTK